MSKYEVVRDANGNGIAWLTSDWRNCENPQCRKEIAAGRPVHLIPAHTDPRAAEVYLALPTYHFETKEAALAALENAWATAETVCTSEARDQAYALLLPVKIAKNRMFVSCPTLSRTPRPSKTSKRTD